MLPCNAISLTIFLTDYWKYQENNNCPIYFIPDIIYQYIIKTAIKIRYEKDAT